jgi:hypothetical protein
LAGFTIAAAGGVAGDADGQLSLSGTVVNSVTGAPVRYARLRLAGAGTITTQTDGAGAYQFSNLLPGRYVLSVEKQGFSGVDLAGPVELTESREKYVLRMTPTSVLRGRVVDNSGDQVERAAVVVFVSELRAGHRITRVVRIAQTDDRGQYRIAGLSAGSYLIQVSPQTGHQGYYGDTDPKAAERESFAPVFFGGSNEPTQATPVVLAAGVETHADVRVELHPGHRVRGRIDGFRAHTSPTLRLSSGEHDLGMNVSSVEYSTGRFEIRGVLDGSYRLRISQNGEGEQVLYGEQNIEVAGRDVEGVVVALAAAPTLKGTARTEPAGTEESAMAVDLDPQDPVVAMGAAMGARFSTPTKDGRFEIRGVTPGKYWVYESERQGAYIASARAGQLDLLASQELTVDQSGAPEIELVVRRDFGRVRGTLGPEAASGGDALLLLAPDGCNRPALTTYASSGTFEFEMAPPGRYRLHAWKRGSEVEYGSREVLCALGHGGIPVEVAPGTEVKVDVPKLEAK